MPVFYRATFYEDDDATVAFVLSTDPAHANPYMQEPTSVGESTVDFLEGKSRIGQATFRVLDVPRLAGDQDSGFLTYHIAKPGGENARTGRRVALERQRVTGGPYILILDGVLFNLKKLTGKDMVFYQIELRDIRERERNFRLFTKTYGIGINSPTVVPIGVQDGYGKSLAGEWLIRPTKEIPLRGTFYRDPVQATTAGRIHSQANFNWLRIGYDRYLWLQSLGQHVHSTDALGNSTGHKATRLVVMWRSFPGGGAYTALENMPYVPDTRWPMANVFDQPTEYPYLAEKDNWKHSFGEQRFQVNLTGPGIPTNNQQIEYYIVPNTEPSELAPVYVEESFGMLLKKAYDGVYSTYDPNIRYDNTRMNEMVTETPIARAVIKKAKPNARDWLEEHVYKVTGHAPVIENGIVTPLRYRLPNADVVLTQLDDTNMDLDPTWEQSQEGTINTITFTWLREFLRPKEYNQEPDLLRLTADEDTREHVRGDAAALLGLKDIVFKPETVRTIQDATMEKTGDKVSEVGMFLALQRIFELRDRFAFGTHKVKAKALRSVAAVEATKAGDWATVGVSWLPNPVTRKLGMNRLMQVVGAKDLDPIWKELSLLDAGPDAQPIAQPTSVIVALVNNTVTVTLTPESGMQARVDFAVGAVQPATDSGDWTWGGRVVATGTITLGPFADGQTVWVRTRGEMAGRRPSAWTVPVSQSTTVVPRVYNFWIELSGNVPTLFWQASPGTLGVRIQYEVHDSGVDFDGVFDNTVDQAVAVGLTGYALPVVLLHNQAVTVRLTPYAGWTGVAVSGAAGNLSPARFSTLMITGQVNPDIDVKVSAANNLQITYEVTAKVADDRVVSLYLADGDGAFSLVVNPLFLVVNRALNTAEDRNYRVLAVTDDGMETTRLISVDFDILPELVGTSSPIAVYNGEVQIGWKLTGSADDDTRAVVFKVTGDLALDAVTPSLGLEDVSATEWWADVTTSKAWTVIVLQSPGQVGTLTITPRELFNPLVAPPQPGLVGQAHVQALAFSPVTTHSVQEIDTKTRRVTFTANPPTAIVNFRNKTITDTWSTSIGNGFIIVDLSDGDQELEFYSVLSPTSVERVQRLVLDEDSLPEITINLTVEPANQINSDVGPDDDVVWYSLWARPSASPLDSLGNPMAQYLRYDGKPHKKLVQFRAVSATWQLIYRAYDKTGEYVQESRSLVVSASPTIVGSLSNLTAISVDHSGAKYIDLLWDHNATVEAGGHTVTIRENTVQVVTGRAAKIEHDDLSAVANVGGYHRAHQIVPEGTPGAVLTAFVYAVDLIRTSDATLLATYSVNISVWLAGGGEGGGGAPTETPNSIAAEANGGGTADGFWNNTNVVASIRVEWLSSTFNGGYALDSTHELTAEAVSHSRSFETGRWAQFRVQYFNAYGSGPWSAYSAGVQVI